MKLFIERLKLVFLVYTSPIIILIMLILVPFLNARDYKARGERISRTLREQTRKAGLPWGE